MTKQHRIPIVLAVVLAVLTATLMAGKAHADVVVTEDPPVGHWDKPVLTVNIPVRLADGWRPRGAIRKWNEVSPVDMVLTAEPDADITVVEVPSFATGDRWGEAQPWLDVNDWWTLEHVEVRLLSSVEPFVRQRVLVHEFGHALGLGHTVDTESVMGQFYYNFKAIQAHDVVALSNLYPEVY